jgi:sugar phosphate isomerase/epimerase
MRFGICVPLGTLVPPTSGVAQMDAAQAVEARVRQVGDALRVVEQAGCDFVEFGVGVVTPEEPDAVFERLQAVLKDSVLAVEAFSSYVPPDIRLVGPARDRGRIERYVAVSARRVAALGGQIIGFGSGKARSVPAGVPRETADAQLVEFLHLAADHAALHGIRIAIEPMNRSESNILNSVAECVTLAERVNRREVGVLVDFYHLELEQEPIRHIAEAGRHVIHVHVADTGRLYPGSGRYDYPAFWRAVRDAGYDGRVTIECNWRDFAHEAAPAMRFLRQSASSAR